MNDSTQNPSAHQLVHNKETVYFILIATFSVLTYLLLSVTIIGIIFLLVMVLISVILHGVMIGGIRRNGVKISEKQFPELYEKAIVTAHNMGLKKIPDIYVIESQGVLNAFATRFFGRNMVVLYSEIFELLEKDAEKELFFVLAHEFTHIKRNHIGISTFLLPAMWIPFLGNAYLRACEYTCDRTAAYYVQSYEASKNALTILAIGKTLYPKVNKEAYMEQLQTESGFFVWLNEKLSTHPHLPKRIYALSEFFSPETTTKLKEPTGKVWIGAISLIVLIVVLSVGITFGLNKLESLPVWSDLPSTEDVDADLSSNDFLEEDSVTDLMRAAAENDIETLTALIEKGVNLEEIDSDGYTALHWAVLYDHIDTANTLLDSGANPNAIDYFNSTPLLTAVYNENPEMVKLLLEHGVNVDFKDSEGKTATDYATESGNIELISLLEGY